MIKIYAVPSPPRGLNVVLLDEDQFQVQVTWNVPKEVNGNLMGYQVIWGRKGEAYQTRDLSPLTQSFISGDILGMQIKTQFIDKLGSIIQTMFP